MAKLKGNSSEFIDVLADATETNTGNYFIQMSFLSYVFE
jgi:hypothetical protein